MTSVSESTQRALSAARSSAPLSAGDAYVLAAVGAARGPAGLAGCRLMAARDDLMVNLGGKPGGNPAEMLPALGGLVVLGG